MFNSLFLTINDICRYNAVKNIYFKLVSNLQSRIVEKSFHLDLPRWLVGGEEAVGCMGKEEWTVWEGCGGELAVWCLGGGDSRLVSYSL